MMVRSDTKTISLIIYEACKHEIWKLSDSSIGEYASRGKKVYDFNFFGDLSSVIRCIEMAMNLLIDSVNDHKENLHAKRENIRHKLDIRRDQTYAVKGINIHGMVQKRYLQPVIMMKMKIV